MKLESVIDKTNAIIGVKDDYINRENHSRNDRSDENNRYQRKNANQKRGEERNIYPPHAYGFYFRIKIIYFIKILFVNLQEKICVPDHHNDIINTHCGIYHFKIECVVGEQIRGKGKKRYDGNMNQVAGNALKCYVFGIEKRNIRIG